MGGGKSIPTNISAGIKKDPDTEAIQKQKEEEARMNEKKMLAQSGASSFYGCNLSCNPNSSPASNGQLNYNCTMTCNPR